MTTDPARPFGRVLTAMVTPFTEDGSVDLAGAQELAAHLVDRGAHDGLVVLGTTGEAPTVSDAEQRTLLEAVLDAVGDRAVVVAGVGTNDTAHSIENARSAERLGVHGLLVVTPYYNRPSQAGLLRHFTAVADATDLPVMLYDIPPRSIVPIEVETLVRLAEHPRIVAVKDAKGNLGDVAWTLARTDLAYYSGEDMLNFPLLALGAVGVVSVVGHLVGPRLAELVAAVESGDLVKARAVNESLLPVFTGVMGGGQGAMMVKAALKELRLPPARSGRRWSTPPPSRWRSCGRTWPPGASQSVSGQVTQPHLELQAPPPLPDGGLRVMALGGLGEIGRNMAVLEFEGRLLVIDCGVLFPEAEQPGIDLILPDFGVIEHRLDDIDAVVLTHGHEDHIGAVPYLLRMRGDIPLIGSRFTLALVGAKLREHRIEPILVEVAAGDDHVAGPFHCEFISVNHSIPDALAVAVHTPAGVLVHTGDFKMDQLPLDGVLTDLGAFARLGLSGIDLLLSDSTNAEIPGFVTPERSIGPVLDDVFGRATQRLIVSSFASHVHRIQQVLDCAEIHQRKVAFVGRSMVRNMGVARDLGLLRVAAGLMVSLDEAASMPPEQVVLVSTGSQGEPLSALGRMARGEHHQVTIESGDTVVLASSLVPGNETAVYKVINGLARLGATVVHKETARVHVSGHAPAGELRTLLNVAKPRYLMPVHGEWRHLRAHAALAEETGMSRDRVLLAEDGVVVDLVDGKASIVGSVPIGNVYVDGLNVGDVGEESLQARRILGDEGFVALTVVIEPSTRTIVRPVHLSTRGFSDDPAAFDGALHLVEENLKRALEDGEVDPHRLAQTIRRTVGKWVSDTYRRRPMIIPTVLEV